MIIKRRHTMLRPEPKPLKKSAVILIIFLCIVSFAVGIFAAGPILSLFGI